MSNNPPCPTSRSTRLACRTRRLKVGVELDTGDIILTWPQPPATQARCASSCASTASPRLGRPSSATCTGYEKLAEFRTYPQITTLINRIDWLSSFATRCRSSTPPRSPDGHPGAAAGSTSAPSSPSSAASPPSSCSSARWACRWARSRPRSTASATREHVLNLIEGASGGRFHPNFNRIGGIKDDLPWGWVNQTRRVMKLMFDACDTFEDLVAGNEIFEARTRSIGIIPAELGAAYGVSGSNPLLGRRLGPPARRQALPRLPRPRLQGVDASRRRLVRPLLGAPPGDARSCRMVLQMLDQMPAGPIMAKVPYDQGARGRGLDRDREPARADGLLRRLQGCDRPVPREDPLGVVQQRLDPAVVAALARSCPT